ncbi:MAG: non-canonical purine NTP pyrophosphatase, partial [Clostridia bacterium]|nr:non-canonical purine NTP pyrophosphatase [Clostridia bacterium]
MKLVIASNNEHKIEEIKQILQGKFEEMYSLAEMGIDCDPVEDGQTFLDNALIKVNEIAKYTQYAVLGDDTGLCVEALGGAPGVMSAR